MKRSACSAMLLLPVLACAAPGAAKLPQPTESRVEFNPNFGSGSDGLAPGWLGYAMARVAGPPEAGLETPSANPAPFEEEAYARESLALIWGELAAERGYRDKYLGDLVKVQTAGFIREYTWECIRTLKGEAPSGLDLAGFRAWFASNLKGHQVESWSFAVEENGAVVVHVGEPAHTPYQCVPAA